MVLVSSVRIPRVPTYSGFHTLRTDFAYGTFTLFRRAFQLSSAICVSCVIVVLTPYVFLPTVWASPISLATTFGIVFYFLLLRVLRCFSSPGSLHIPIDSVYDTAKLLAVSSLIRISVAQSFICNYPQLFAACHVLLRRHMPRHPPVCSL